MAYITTRRYNNYYNQLLFVQSQIDAYEAAYLAAIPNVEIQKYDFDSNEGRQRVERRNPQEIQDILDGLYSKQDWLLRKLQGGGIVNMNVRRKPYGVRNRI